MKLLDICVRQDVILPLSTGYEKAFIFTELVRTFAKKNPKEIVVYIGEQNTSSLLFLNSVKMFNILPINEVLCLDDIDDDMCIVFIHPECEEKFEIISKIKNSIKLMIFDDLHIIFNESQCLQIQILEMFHSSKIPCRIVGFSIPLQTSTFKIPFENSKDYAKEIERNFNIPVEMSFDMSLKHKFVKLEQIKICQFKNSGERFEELQETLGKNISFHRYLLSMKNLLEISNNLTIEVDGNDKYPYQFQKANVVALLQPFSFLDFISNILKILYEYGELCALKAIDYYYDEIYYHLQAIHDRFCFSEVFSYINFLRKSLSQLKTFKTSILLYLPVKLRKKLLDKEPLSIKKFLALSTPKLNCFVEEVVKKYENHPLNDIKIVVNTDLNTSSKVLASWIHDLSNIISKSSSNNPLAKMKAFYYLTSNKEKDLDSKLLKEIYFYRNRENELNKFIEKSSNSINILFSASHSLPKPGIPCDLYIALNQIDDFFRFVRLKEDLQMDCELSVISEEICEDRLTKLSCLDFWKNIVDQESFYFNIVNKTKLIHHISSSISVVDLVQNIILKKPFSITNPKIQQANSDSVRKLNHILKKNNSPNFSGKILKSKTFKAEHVYEIVFKNCSNYSSNNMRKLAFIVPEDLPELLPLSVPHQFSEIDVEIVKLDISIELSVGQNEKIFCFNSVIYERIFNIACNIENDCSSKLLLVPLNSYGTNFDWALIDDYLTSEFKRFRGTIFRPEHFNDAIVCSFFKKTKFFYVDKIDFEKTPRSCLHGSKSLSIANFYKTSYGLTVSNLRQPLLKVIQLLPAIEFLKIFDPKTIWIIPEFYHIWTLPFSLWLKISSLPLILTTIFAQNDAYKFNVSIFENICQKPHKLDSNKEILKWHIEKEFHLETGFDFSSVPVFDTENMDADYGKPIFKDEQQEKVLKKLEDYFNEFSEPNVDDEQNEKFLDGNPDIIGFLSEQAYNDTTNSEYKKIALSMDKFKFELSYPQTMFEALVDTEEYRCEKSLSALNFQKCFYFQDKVIKEENDQIDTLCENVYPLIQSGNYDFSDSELITENTKNIRQILRNNLECYFYLIDSDDYVCSSFDSKALQDFCQFEVLDRIYREDKVKLKKFEKFFDFKNSKTPKFQDLLHVTSLSFFSNFQILKEFAFIGKTFIRYVISMMILDSKSQEELFEEFYSLRNDRTLQKLCVEIAIEKGFGSLIEIDFKVDSWCPGYFSETNFLNREHKVSEEILEQTVQAYVGIYYKYSGPVVAMDVMKALGFKDLENFDTKRLDNWQWKDFKIFEYFSELNDSEIFTRMDDNFHFDVLEQELGYTFKNRNLLYHSFIDSSLGSNVMKILSNFGKNILDFIIANCAFEVDQTLCSTADYFLLSSNLYSIMALQLNFNKLIAHNSVKIFTLFHIFLRISYQSSKELSPLRLFTEYDNLKEDLIEIPTILIDSFQSVMAAIYIDSEYCLKSVYDVFSPFLASIIRDLKNIKNPYSSLIIQTPCEFSEPIIKQNGDIEITCDLSTVGRTTAYASTERMAKEICSKKMLRFISILQNQRNDEDDQDEESNDDQPELNIDDNFENFDDYYIGDMAQLNLDVDAA